MLKMSPDRLLIQSESNFSTIRANVCCFSGKWQYELQLLSKGVMQLGWAMNKGEFTPETGVGDTVYSYAFDGNRVRKWNLVAEDYGEAWQTGDIVGCTIDLDIGSVHFYRNGRDLGEAFTEIPLGPGCAYFPAISLAFDEKVQANFGATPFKYPEEMFLPLQKPPIGAVRRTNSILRWITRLYDAPPPTDSIQVEFEDPNKVQPSAEAIRLLFCEMLVKHLSLCLNVPYVVEACLLPYFHGPNKTPLAIINNFFESISLFLEPEDFNQVVNLICKSLVMTMDETSLTLENEKQRYSLTVFSKICQNATVRRILMKQPGFLKSKFGHFMDEKPIDLVSLKQFVSVAWWDSPGRRNKITTQNKNVYLHACETIKRKTQELEHMQENVLLLMLNNKDGSLNEATSRKQFLHMLRLLLRDNHISGMVNAVLANQQYAGLLPLSMGLSLWHRLVDVLKLLWAEEYEQQPVYVPASVFYSGSVEYYSIERLGGLFSHLVHTMRPALAQELGEDHTVLTIAPATTSASQPITIQVQLREMNRNLGTYSSMTRRFNLQTTEQVEKDVTTEQMTTVASLTELLDSTIMLYNLAAHKQINKITSIRDDMDKYIKALDDARQSRRMAKDPETVGQIDNSIQAFEQKLTEQSRTIMSWVRGTVFTDAKRENLVWLLKAVLLTLERASETGDFFSFVPEFYIDSLAEMCSALTNCFHPVLPLDDVRGHYKLLRDSADFFARHFQDTRIVNPHVKDVITEALAGFMSNKLTLKCLETMSDRGNQAFIRVLLSPYEDRAWGQTNWILMRMWQGHGFAFRYKTPPHIARKFTPRTPALESVMNFNLDFAIEPNPSPHFQQQVASTLDGDKQVASEFLNSVLKQLNWTFSELISMLQEIHNLSKRTDRVIIDARQLKMCAACYEFVISLLRVLEMVCTKCLQVLFNCSENMVERLCQLLNQILLRISAQGGSFSQVVSLEVPDLDVIDKFPILAAVAGILVALLAEDLAKKDVKRSTSMSASARCLLSEPSFDIESLKYLIGESQSTHNKNENEFSFENYQDAVTSAEVKMIRQMIDVLSYYKTVLPLVKDTDDENLCQICCAMPLSVTFIPCHHQSCRSCITHYLMDNTECFFCKATISSVVSEDGTVLYDNKAAKPQSSFFV